MLSQTKLNLVQGFLEDLAHDQELHGITQEEVRSFFKAARVGVLLDRLKELGSGWGIHYRDSCYTCEKYCGCSVGQDVWYVKRDSPQESVAVDGAAIDLEYALKMLLLRKGVEL